MNLPKINLSAETLARFLGLMLIAWQPFWSGARLPTLLLVLLGAWMLLHKQIDFSSTAAKRLGMVFLLLGIPVLISIPGSYDVQGSISVAIVLLLFYVVGLALLQGLAQDQGRTWLQHWLLIVITAWVIDGCIQFVFGYDLLGVPMSEDKRILGPFAGNLHLGLFATILLPLVLWQHARRHPWFALTLVGLVGFVAGMSGARSNVLFLLLGCALLLPIFGWRQRVAMTGVVLATLIAATMLSPSMAQRVKNFAQVSSPDEISVEQQFDNITSLRLTIWKSAWQMIQDRPLNGVGTNAFAEAYDHYSPAADDPFRSSGPMKTPYHAHQMYVSVAAESGWPGLIGLISIVVLSALWLYRSPSEQRRQAAPFAASLAVIAFPIQSQPVLYSIWWFPVVLLLLCGMIAALNASPRTKKKPS
ncbi:MAG: O-antigen ligase family protein [Hydrogenophilaceae bacterium]|nr:O-antigen ligase family protein [Hydrogenophilaceae bacterium]